MLAITWEKLKLNKEAIENKIQEEKEKNEGNIENTEDSILEGSTREKLQWNGSYSSKDYNPVFHLVTNDDKRSFGDIFKRSLAAVYLTKCLQIIKYFDEDSTEDDFLFVASLVLRHLQSSSCNAYEISEYETASEGEVPNSHELGGAIYSSISMTNHSCYANTARYNIGSSCVLRATRSISSGEEVLDNYGYLFRTTPVVEREAGLYNQYKFHCTCEACTQGWELYPHKTGDSLYFKCPAQNCGKPVPFSDIHFVNCPECENKQQYGKLLKEVSKQMDNYNDIMLRIQKGDRFVALGQLLEHQAFLDKYAVPPCSHCTDVQEAIGYCYNFLGNLFSHEVRPSEIDIPVQQKTVSTKVKQKKKYVSSSK